MNRFFRVKMFLKYLRNAKTKYYLHSPFVYQFYLKVLEGEPDTLLRSVFVLCNKLRANNSLLQITDFGTGILNQRSVADLEMKVAVRQKYGALLYRLVKYFQPKNILEIGTSIGLSSSYMALANASAKIITLEGSPEIVAVAKKNHTALQIQNIEVVVGDFNETLSPALKDISSLDLVFFDGNHTKQATLDYFNQCLVKANEHSIFVFDDIYWSKEMCEAWQEIKQHPQITLTLDVYQFGICFFKKEKLSKENFVLWY